MIQKHNNMVAFVFTSFVLFSIIDSVLTYWGVTLGLMEGNLFMRTLIEQGWVFFFTFKIVVYGTLAKVCMRMNNVGIPIILTLMGTGVAAWNVILITSAY